jgi:hypothetical protein
VTTKGSRRERDENCKSVWGRGLLGTVLSGRSPGGRGNWDPPLQALNHGTKGHAGGRPHGVNSGHTESPDRKRETFFFTGNNKPPCSSGSPGFFRCQNTRLGDPPVDPPSPRFPGAKGPAKDPPSPGFSGAKGPASGPALTGIFRCQGRTLSPHREFPGAKGGPPPSPENPGGREDPPPLRKLSGGTAPLAAERAGTWQRERERYPLSPPPL